MTEAPEPSLADPIGVRPMVAKPSGNRTAWIFAGILAAAGGGMFYALQVNRMELASRSGIVQEPAPGGMIVSPPELVIPTGGDAYPETPGYPAGQAAPTSLVHQPAAAAITAVSREAGYRGFTDLPSAPVQALPEQSRPDVPGFAYQAPAQPSTGMPGQDNAKNDDDRVEAGRLRNPATTVPQGSVIQAIMETALDSTRAGFARAIVSRDVVSFDGTRVLIPKGSKLFGEYQADVSLGQKRALIQWRRLTRPDGAIIDLDSPSADPLGRAGVKGKVNTHFFQRFSGAILQSILDIGVRAATREAAGDTVVLALPNSATQVGSTSLQRSDDIKPTLKIRQGASVSVFVARDLDFTAVGG